MRAKEKAAADAAAGKAGPTLERAMADREERVRNTFAALKARRSDLRDQRTALDQQLEQVDLEIRWLQGEVRAIKEIREAATPKGAAPAGAPADSAAGENGAAGEEREASAAAETAAPAPELPLEARVRELELELRARELEAKLRNLPQAGSADQKGEDEPSLDQVPEMAGAAAAATAE